MAAEAEVRRFLGSVARDEWWQWAPPWWRLRAAHGRALVRRAVTGPAWAWAVQVEGGGAPGRIVQGDAPSEHEAMRMAERVLEEHRPGGGQHDGR